MIIFFLKYFLCLLVLPMMNVLKKNIHSFVGLSATLDPSTTTDKFHLHSRHHRVSSFTGGLGLIDAAKDGNKLPHVLESAMVKPTAKREIGGVEEDELVDGLASCTESLGFESSDERRADDPVDEIKEMINYNNKDDINDCWRKIGNHKKEKRFPPPLTSLNMNGQPSFFLRPVRKDGRLELTEVRIHRHEIIHASRQDGRLRLHLIPDDDDPDDEDEEEEQDQLQEEEEEEEVAQEEEMREAIRDERSEEEEEEDERVGEEWRRAMGGSSEGIRRCHEVVNHGKHHHHHHHLQICGVSIM